jgi:hypothetical protein
MEGIGTSFPFRRARLVCVCLPAGTSRTKPSILHFEEAVLSLFKMWLSLPDTAAHTRG